jgi:uncharacterized protein (TIGR03083 family)
MVAMTNTSDAEARITALRASHDRLRSVVDSLTPEQVRAGSYASEWTIAQVLSHLGSGAQINTLILEAGLTGQDAPAQEAFQAVWAVWDAKTPEEQAADVLLADEILVQKVEALTPAQRDTAKFALWSGPADIGGFAASRLGEHAVHVWDVEVAIDPSATIPAPAAGIVLEGAGLIAGFTSKPAPEGRIHVTTTDPAREFALTTGEKATLEPWDGGEGTGELGLPAEAFLRLIYGRLDAEHTPPVTATGIELDTLRTVFPGF